jgi:hypothetical protein
VDDDEEEDEDEATPEWMTYSGIASADDVRIREKKHSDLASNGEVDREGVKTGGKGNCTFHRFYLSMCRNGCFYWLPFLNWFCICKGTRVRVGEK